MQSREVLLNTELVPADLMEETVHREPKQRDRPLSFHWRTVDFDRIRALGIVHDTDKRRNTARNSILTEAVLARDEGRWVSYSRRKEFYVGSQRYHGTAYTHAIVTSVVDEMVRLSLIEEQRALPGDRGWQSRFRATSLLMKGLADAAFEHHLYGFIRLKDAEGRLIDFHETRTTIRMRRDLEEINAFLGAVDLHLAAPGIVRTQHHLLIGGAHYRPTSQPSLYRVFNRGRFSLGGRAYGWWQSLPKDYRRQLLIGGQAVSEPDFVQMHASILYARRGLQLKHDVYETEEFSRDEGKLAFNVALNAKTLQGAVAALVNKPNWSHSPRDTVCLIKALKRRNAPIADDLHADRGVELMHIDSEITLRAVSRCVRASIPVLPVHDAILTPARHADHVAEIMEESAAQYLKAVNPCRVKVLGHMVPQMPSRGPFFSPPPAPRPCSG